jgi:hypothetical protein
MLHARPLALAGLALLAFAAVASAKGVPLSSSAIFFYDSEVRITRARQAGDCHGLLAATMRKVLQLSILLLSLLQRRPDTLQPLAFI